jgi:hypothetical protein
MWQKISQTGEGGGKWGGLPMSVQGVGLNEPCAFFQEVIAGPFCKLARSRCCLNC